MTGVDAVRQVGDKATAHHARAEAAQVGVKMTRSIVYQQGAHAPPIPKVLGQMTLRSYPGERWGHWGVTS